MKQKSARTAIAIVMRARPSELIKRLGLPAAICGVVVSSIIRYSVAQSGENVKLEK